MGLEIQLVTIQNVLTRTSGYLQTVSSHSLQPYRGCSFGNSLCGVGCYVQHNGTLLQGRKWGSFLDIRTNAAESYAQNYSRELTWARKHLGRFSIFCSSSADPFVPQERRYGITRQILERMLIAPPDLLILQSHSPAVAEYIDLLLKLMSKCEIRVHISIETDRDRLPGLPPPAASVDARFAACKKLNLAGIPTVITVAPLLPIQDPVAFFQRISECAETVVVDHFIGGDGSSQGSRTQKTELPSAMFRLNPNSLTIDYREEILAVAQAIMPGRVGVGIDGFAGRLLDIPKDGDRNPTSE